MDDLPEFTWHSRGYLPHWEAGERPQFLTYRLADTLPHHVVDELCAELQALRPGRWQASLHSRLERYLDQSVGACYLARPAVAQIVQNSLLQHDAAAYRLLEWVIMPNHVHALLVPIPPETLTSIMRGHKGSTARAINPLLGRTGRFWHPDYYDRLVRDEEHLVRVRNYIARNPVAAGLCGRQEDWVFSSCHVRP